jgi:hypothetical protein
MGTQIFCQSADYLGGHKTAEPVECGYDSLKLHSRTGAKVLEGSQGQPALQVLPLWADGWVGFAEAFGRHANQHEYATTILGLLVEGMSVRAEERITGTCRKTICDLIPVAGENCHRSLETKIEAVQATDV